MSPMVRRRTPACCADNVTSGFVHVLETRTEGDEVVGTRFWIMIVDALGLTHTRETKHCPACSLDLLIGRNGSGVPCVTVDAWSSPLVDDEQERAIEAIKKMMRVERMERCEVMTDDETERGPRER